MKTLRRLLTHLHAAPERRQRGAREIALESRRAFRAQLRREPWRVL